MQRRILIIDDDIQIGNLEQEVLEKEGYLIMRAYSGTEALLILERERPDLILLDLMLPGIDGEEVLAKIHGIPVIIVSAKVGIDDKVAMLAGGATDYITKPFDIRELAARVAVQFRTPQRRKENGLKFAEIEIDTNLHKATASGKELNLTKTEYAILKLLMVNKDQVIAKNVILDRISEDTPDCTESSLKTHISHLRGKLRGVTGKEYIESVWGIGFKLHDE